MAPRLLLDSLRVLGTRVLMRLANFLVLMILARALPLEAFGTYGLAVVTLLMLSFMLDFGVRQSSAVAIGREPVSPEVTTHLVAITVISSLLALVAAFVAMQSLTGALSTNVSWIVAMTAVPVMILRCLQGTQLGLGRLDQLNLSELLPRALTLGGVCLLWPLGVLSLETALITSLLAHWVGAIYLIVVTRSLISLRLRLQGAQISSLLRHGLVFAAGGIAMLLLGRVSIWIISAMEGAAEVGIYFAALRLSELPVEVASSVGVALFSYGVRRNSEAPNGMDTARTVRSVNVLLIVGVLAMAVLAQPMLELSFGEEFGQHAMLFRIMLIGTVVSCTNMMLYPCLAATGRARIGLFAYGPGLVLSAVLTWILIQHYGLYGAALAVVIPKIWVLLVLVVAFKRQFDIPLKALIVPSLQDFKPLWDRAQSLRRRSRPKTAPSPDAAPIPTGDITAASPVGPNGTAPARS